LPELCQIDRQRTEEVYLEVSIGFLVNIHVLPALKFCEMASGIGDDANSFILVAEEIML
jgi:hypothetical protein